MGLNSQVVFSPAYNNYDDLYKDLVDHPHVSFISSNWSNYELNQNLNLLEGAKCIKVTGGSTHGKSGKKFINGLAGQPFIVYQVGPQDIVSHSYSSFDEKTNVSVMDNFEKYHQIQVQEIIKNNKQLEERKI